MHEGVSLKEVTVTFYPDGAQPVTLTCEVAKTIFEKERGLMYRSSLHADGGMLFPFLFLWFRLFWMKGVSIPLDIIFVGKNFKVVKIFGAPANVGFLNKRFWVHGFAKYVIECNLGFCKSHGISVGTSIVFK